MPNWITALFKPVADIFTAREQRKAAKESAAAKLSQAKQDDTYQLELNDQEWEQIQSNGLKDSWKDEYVTLSVMSIFNLIVIGGILAAFDKPELLEGVGIAVQALTTAGVDVGFLLTATVTAGLGLSVWRKF